MRRKSWRLGVETTMNNGHMAPSETRSRQRSRNQDTQPARVPDKVGKLKPHRGCVGEQCNSWRDSTNRWMKLGAHVSDSRINTPQARIYCEILGVSCTVGPYSAFVLILSVLVACLTRSEQRRVGKECFRTCVSGWSPLH